MLYICNKINLINDDLLSTFLPLLSEERRVKYNRLRSMTGKKGSVVAYLLLRLALSDEYDINDTVEFEYAKNGKPFLRDHPDIYFNLSHSGDAAACVVAGVEVGVDIQCVKPISDKVAKRVLTSDEYRVFKDTPEPDDWFCRIWTMKESFVKKTGQGMAVDFREISAGDINDAYVNKGAGFYCCVCGFDTDVKYVGSDDFERLF